jgi:hypothetical protein
MHQSLWTLAGLGNVGGFVSEVFANRTGIIGVITFVVSALPATPPWIAWPPWHCSHGAGRLAVVGDRHHQKVSAHQEMENNELADTRAQRIQDLLSEDRRP